MHTGPSLNRYAEKLRAHLKGVELPILLLVLLLGTGVWGSAEVADAVSEEETQQIDETILLAMRTPGDLGDPYGPLWLAAVWFQHRNVVEQELRASRDAG